MTITTLNDYQYKASAFVTYGPKPLHEQFLYEALGLAGEAGELAGHVAKAIRDEDYPTKGLTPDRETLIRKELGDVLWFVAALADSMGYSLRDIANSNLQKLQDRKDRGVIQGSGDHR